MRNITQINLARIQKSAHVLCLWLWSAAVWAAKLLQNLYSMNWWCNATFAIWFSHLLCLVCVRACAFCVCELSVFVCLRMKYASRFLVRSLFRFQHWKSIIMSLWLYDYPSQRAEKMLAERVFLAFCHAVTRVSCVGAAAACSFSMPFCTGVNSPNGPYAICECQKKAHKREQIKENKCM